MHGANYPPETMVALADDRVTAERAAGFAESDIYLLNGREAWERIQEKKADRNIFERIFDNIQEMDARTSSRALATTSASSRRPARCSASAWSHNSVTVSGSSLRP